MGVVTQFSSSPNYTKIRRKIYVMHEKFQNSLRFKIASVRIEPLENSIVEPAGSPLASFVILIPNGRNRE